MNSKRFLMDKYEYVCGRTWVAGDNGLLYMIDIELIEEYAN